MIEAHCSETRYIGVPIISIIPDMFLMPLPGLQLWFSTKLNPCDVQSLARTHNTTSIPSLLQHK